MLRLMQWQQHRVYYFFLDLFIRYNNNDNKIDDHVGVMRMIQTALNRIIFGRCDGKKANLPSGTKRISGDWRPCLTCFGGALGQSGGTRKAAVRK